MITTIQEFKCRKCGLIHSETAIVAKELKISKLTEKHYWADHAVFMPCTDDGMETAHDLIVYEIKDNVEETIS